LRSAEKLFGLELHLYLQKCVNMADPVQLSAVGDDYADKGMASFHILDMD
jgi:hypothetical protein